MDDICDICNKEKDELFACIRCSRLCCERCINDKELCRYCMDEIDNHEEIDWYQHLACAKCGAEPYDPLIECSECGELFCADCIKDGMCFLCYRKKHGQRRRKRDGSS